MSQTTLDDEDLFDEAATEMRSDVEDAIAAARDELPDPDDIWTVESENVLGVLNALRSSLAVNDAATHIRDAKKWYMIGERADVFDDASDLKTEIDTLETAIERVEHVHDSVSELASTLPELRNDLANLAIEESP